MRYTTTVPFIDLCKKKTQCYLHQREIDEKFFDCYLNSEKIHLIVQKRITGIFPSTNCWTVLLLVSYTILYKSYSSNINSKEILTDTRLELIVINSGEIAPTRKPWLSTCRSFINYVQEKANSSSHQPPTGDWWKTVKNPRVSYYAATMQPECVDSTDTGRSCQTN